MILQLREFSSLMDAAIPPTPDYSKWDPIFSNDTRDEYFDTIQDLKRSFKDATGKFSTVLAARFMDVFPEHPRFTIPGDLPNRRHHATVEDAHSDHVPATAQRSQEPHYPRQPYHCNSAGSISKSKRRRDSSEDIGNNPKRVRGTLPDSTIPTKRKHADLDTSETGPKRLKGPGPE